MTRDRRDRRRTEAPRSTAHVSPANYLIGTIVLVLAATAAATAFLGPGFGDATPHGQVLGELDRVARAQADFHGSHGRFATWLRTLGMEPDDDVSLTMLHADSVRWEVIASHTVGLTCSQSGHVGERGRPVRDRPVCYTEPGD